MRIMSRLFVVALLFALVGCGQPFTPIAPSAPVAAQSADTAAVTAAPAPAVGTFPTPTPPTSPPVPVLQPIPQPPAPIPPPPTHTAPPAHHPPADDVPPYRLFISYGSVAAPIYIGNVITFGETIIGGEGSPTPISTATLLWDLDSDNTIDTTTIGPITGQTVEMLAKVCGINRASLAALLPNGQILTDSITYTVSCLADPKRWQ